MTTYNGVDFLLPQLDSIRHQTLLPDEVVIVDDKSTDGTVQLVQDYIRQHKLKGWQIVVNEANLGWRKNFRKALFATSGDIVFLADQDDIWEVTKIEEQSKPFLMKARAEVVISNYDVLYGDRLEAVKLKNINKDDASLQRLDFNYRSIYVLRPGCTFAVRRSIIEMMKRYDMEDYAHDGVLWNLAAIRGSLYLYNRKLIQFRRHLNSASTPSVGLNRERRIEETKIAERVATFLSQTARSEQLSAEQIAKLDKIRYFLEKRLDLLLKGNVLSLLWFQLRYFYYYPTLRNLLSDSVVLLRKKS